MQKKYQFRDKHLNTLNEIGVYVDYYPDYSHHEYEPHSTDVILLSFIITGTGVHILGGEKFIENGSSLSIIHYGQEHDILGDHLEVFNIFIDPERAPLPALPQTLNTFLSQIIPLSPNFHSEINTMVRLELSDPQRLKNIAMAMIKEQEERAMGYKEILLDYLKIFLSLCCREAELHDHPKSSDPDAPASQQLEILRRYIDINYTEQLQLDQLAKKHGFNKSYLCRAFKKYTGKSIIAYQLERKIQHAMLELTSSNNKILAIALDNGFQNLGFFNKKFKEISGISPRQYRNKVRQ